MFPSVIRDRQFLISYIIITYQALSYQNITYCCKKTYLFMVRRGNSNITIMLGYNPRGYIMLIFANL